MPVTFVAPPNVEGFYGLVACGPCSSGSQVTLQGNSSVRGFRVTPDIAQASSPPSGTLLTKGPGRNPGLSFSSAAGLALAARRAMVSSLLGRLKHPLRAEVGFSRPGYPSL